MPTPQTPSPDDGLFLEPKLQRILAKDAANLLRDNGRFPGEGSSPKKMSDQEPEKTSDEQRNT